MLGTKAGQVEEGAAALRNEVPEPAQEAPRVEEAGRSPRGCRERGSRGSTRPFLRASPPHRLPGARRCSALALRGTCAAHRYPGRWQEDNAAGPFGGSLSTPLVLHPVAPTSILFSKVVLTAPRAPGPPSGSVQVSPRPLACSSHQAPP